jgi:hypothetical protein
MGLEMEVEWTQVEDTITDPILTAMVQYCSIGQATLPLQVLVRLNPTVTGRVGQEVLEVPPHQRKQVQVDNLE